MVSTADCWAELLAEHLSLDSVSSANSVLLTKLGSWERLPHSYPEVFASSVVLKNLACLIRQKQCNPVSVQRLFSFLLS